MSRYLLLSDGTSRLLLSDGSSMLLLGEAFPDEALSVKVEVALGADLTAAPTVWVWTDLSTRLFDQTAQVRRGRSDETSRPQPAAVRLEFDNNDGALTTGNPLSVYYPSFKRGVPLRVTIDNTVGNTVRFLGQIAEIVPTWPEGDLSTASHLGEARVEVTGAGVLRRMTQGAKPLGSALARSIPTLGPVAYWPLEDERGATGAASPMATVPAMRAINVGFSANDTLPGSKSLPTMSAGSKLVGVVPDAADGQWSTQFAYLPTSAPASASVILDVRCTGTIRRWAVQIQSGLATLNWYYQAGGQGSSTIGMVSDDFDGWIWMQLINRQVGGTIEWTLGWANLHGLTSGNTGNIGGTVGHVTGADLPAQNMDGWAFGHLSVFPLSSYIVNSFPIYGFAGETAGDRLVRLCAEEGIPLTVTGDIAATTRMGPQGADTLPSLLFECQEADLGILPEQIDQLGLRYRTRGTLYNQTPVLVLDAAGNEICAPFTPIDDDQRLRNDVTAQRSGGSSYRAADETSIDAEGTYDTQVTVNVANDEQLVDQAGWRLHLGTWGGMRYPTVTVDLAIAPHLAGGVVAVKEGDRIQVVNLPQHPAAAVDLIVEGITESAAPLDRRFEFVCSPAGPWNVNVMESTTMGRLDTAGSSLVAAVSAVATALSVATSTGPVWIDTAGHAPSFPFDITMGGEVMTVTAVTGTTSPQTFTVTRSVNGVIKTQPAAAALSLATPLVLAL